MVKFPIALGRHMQYHLVEQNHSPYAAGSKEEEEEARGSAIPFEGTPPVTLRDNNLAPPPKGPGSSQQHHSEDQALTCAPVGDTSPNDTNLLHSLQDPV
jgi:hypothetical protein